MEGRQVDKRFASAVRVARQLLSSDRDERLAGLRRLEEDLFALEQFWGFPDLLDGLQGQPWEPGQDEVLQPLRLVASARNQLHALRSDPDKRIRGRAARLCALIDEWEKIEAGELEPPFLTRLFVPIRVSSISGLSLVRRRNWFIRVWVRLLEKMLPVD